MRARDFIFFTTDLQWIITQQFTARADLFLKYNLGKCITKPVKMPCASSGFLE